VVVSGPWTYLDWWHRMRQLDLDEFVVSRAVAEAPG
jgi:hypothetical protein